VHESAPVVVQVSVPGEEVAVYLVTGDPLAVAAFQLTVAFPSPLVAPTVVGANGAVAGVTVFDVDESVLVPTPFVATTQNAYAVPLVSPVTVQVSAGARTLQPYFPVVDVTL